MPRYSHSARRFMAKHLQILTLSTLPSHTDPACEICYENFDDDTSAAHAPAQVVNLPLCRHIFGAQCWVDWLEEHSTCPKCRTKFFSMDEEHRESRVDFVEEEGGEEGADDGWRQRRLEDVMDNLNTTWDEVENRERLQEMEHEDNEEEEEGADDRLEVWFMMQVTWIYRPVSEDEGGHLGEGEPVLDAEEETVLEERWSVERVEQEREEAIERVDSVISASPAEEVTSIDEERTAENETEEEVQLAEQESAWTGSDATTAVESLSGAVVVLEGPAQFHPARTLVGWIRGESGLWEALPVADEVQDAALGEIGRLAQLEGLRETIRVARLQRLSFGERTRHFRDRFRRWLTRHRGISR